jgi:tetratricopeptide (TPR) repeat protein
MPNPVKVFISYSYDSKDHKDQILALSDQLRYDGIDCWIDQFENNAPDIGWSQWMLKKINESHFILIICTEFYLKQFSINTKLNEEDLNQNWKGPILDQKSTHSQIKNKKFIPILVSENDTQFIPSIFKESKPFVLESDYEDLHSFLTKQKASENLINQKLTNKPKNKKALSTSSVRNIKNEGVLYLLKQSNIIGDKDDINKTSNEVIDIASEIYDLLNGAQPAIEIVSSYIRETKIPLIQYLLLFKPEDKEISSQNTTGEDCPKFLTAALNLTLEQIQKKCPLAIEFIRLCSFFDSRLIPNEIFLEEKEIDFLENDQDEKTDWNLHWNKIVDITCRYSILNQSIDKQSLRMSGIIQQTIRDNLETAELWAEKSLKTLEAAFPDPDFTSWPICEELIPCSRAMLNWINKFGLQIPQTARLCNDVGYYLNSQGDYAEAEKFFQKAYSIRRNFYGEEHALVASTLSNIAWNHKVRKQHEKAEKAYQETIQLWKKIYFGDHPDVAISLDNLGNFYKDIEQYRKAEEVYKEALEIFEKFLGDEHLDVVHSLNNLALLYKTQARFADAESLYKDALEIHENILGKEHPEIAVAKTNLADLYLKQDRFKDAEFALNEALKIREKAFEKHDPVIASSINNFGILYLKMKNYPLAETHLQKALNLFQNTLGFDDPNTINVMKNLEKTKEKQS